MKNFLCILNLGNSKERMAKARSYPITKIDVTLFTPFMMMQLRVALERYTYLMSEFSVFKSHPYNPNDDFVFEYFDYYALNAALKDFTNPIVKEIYFNLLAHPTSGDPDYLATDFEKKAKLKGVIIGHHLSFCSKICHTNNPNIPIYNSRIQEYLKCVYKIKNSYKDIVDWFYTTNPLIMKDQAELLKWFRTSFPSFSSVSDIKVLDTVIFVWHRYK